MKKKDISSNYNHPLTLLDIASVFLKWRKQTFIITGIISLISIILYFFVFDLIYMSSASIKSTGKSTGLLSSLENLPDISGLDELGVSTGGRSARELASYEEILISRRCIEHLITNFNLMQRDEYRFMEDAVKSFRDNQLKLHEEKLAGVLYIDIYDKDPRLAKEMVEFLLKELDKINIEMSVLNAKNNREFIEGRYLQAKQDLIKAEDTLKAYQQIYGIAPDLQIRAAAQSIFALEAELKTEEVKLDVLKKILSSDQLEVQTQLAKINSLKDQIEKMRTSTDVNDLLRLGNSPQIGMLYLRLQRDVEIQSKILAFILPLFEQAKIEEKRETPSIIILDKPYISERKAKPKRLTMVLLWTFLGFVFSSAFFTSYEKYRSFRFQLKERITNSDSAQPKQSI